MNLPSIKRARPTVIMSGADEKKEATLLRARLRDLEATDEDRASVERAQYAAALHDERRGAVSRLAACEAHDPDAHERIRDPLGSGAEIDHVWSWRQRADAARAHISEIDREIERVSFRAGER